MPVVGSMLNFSEPLFVTAGNKRTQLRSKERVLLCYNRFFLCKNQESTQKLCVSVKSGKHLLSMSKLKSVVTFVY